MGNKNGFEKEIKNIMEEETFDLTLSQETLDHILKNRKKTFKEEISAFLNKEIEIPLIPITIGFIVLLTITIIPKEALKSQNERIIDIGGSQVIIREGYEVSQNENKN